MAEIKVVLSNPKTGKSYQKIIKEPEVKSLIGLKIGYTVKGETIGLAGYEFEITGGSDFAGFPMRRDLPGSGRKKIYAVSGVGLKKKGKGVKQRKTVAGNTIYDRTAQVNMKVMKEGKMPLGEEKAEAPKEEKKEEAKQEKKEAKPESKQ